MTFPDSSIQSCILFKLSPARALRAIASAGAKGLKFKEYRSQRGEAKPDPGQPSNKTFIMTQISDAVFIAYPSAFSCRSKFERKTKNILASRKNQLTNTAVSQPKNIGLIFTFPK